MSEMNALREVLKTIPPGPLNYNSAVVGALVAAWDSISDSDVQSTHREKLYRLEQLHWSPPILTFILERHGGTVNGSSRAALHRWSIDVSNAVATCDPNSYRQIYATDRRLNTMILAKKIAFRIIRQKNSRWLKWSADRLTVRVLLRKFISAYNKQTLGNRYARFRHDLVTILETKGWAQAVGRQLGTYTKHPQPLEETS
jgi:hypothetical protein